jgi:MFS family permease
VVQGAAGALMLALAPVLAVQAVSEAARGRALGILSALAPLGAVCGAVLGGQLIEAARWRWIFFLNAPVALIAMLVGLRQLPADAKPLQLPRAR